MRSSSSFALGDNIENLTLTGTAGLTATGNALDNILTGNGGNNTLDGGAGADTLTGGAGDDIYLVDNIADTVAENPGEGADTVQSAIAYALGANLENLTLTGSASTSGTGNELGNSITGNGAGNVLDGGAGDDTLDGGAGSDTLIGGDGLDTFVMGFGMGADTAVDAQGGTVKLGANLEVADMLATRQGDDLQLQINGAGDSMLLQGYYTSPQASWAIRDGAPPLTANHAQPSGGLRLRYPALLSKWRTIRCRWRPEDIDSI